MNREFENSGNSGQPVGKPTSDPKAQIFYSRPDFVLFHAVETLSQKLGVTRNRIRSVVIKELVDNALDAGAGVQIVPIDLDTVLVRNDGPGIPGTPTEIAALFSTGRSLVSTKLVRLPTRGALGNGLRAVAGAVYASRGTLSVTTGGHRIEISPEADGTSSFRSDRVGPTVGTEVEIRFGLALPRDPNMLHLAEVAINSNYGKTYTGASSPHWYDADAWHGLLQASPADRTVRTFLADFEGCSGNKASMIAQAFKGRLCRSLDREEAARLLRGAQVAARPVNPTRLGALGPYEDDDGGYAKAAGTFQAGGHAPFATIPYVVEAWATTLPSFTLPSFQLDSVQVLVNRTPIIDKVTCRRESKMIVIFGAGLQHAFDLPGRTRFRLELAVTTPFMPLTSDGKAPDLLRFRNALAEVIEKATRRAKRAATARGGHSEERDTKKAFVLAHLDEAVAHVSDAGALRFTSRQLLYRMRELMNQASAGDLTQGTFDKILGDYEKELGHDLPGIIRDPRGTYTLPHSDGLAVQLGTLAVEEYVRPPWTYGAVLYIEKEGFAPLLQSTAWGERHDCVILSSKGQATRAVKDFIDLHADDGEPIKVFCVHDADAAGTIIFQALVEETRARGARQVEIIDLGLQPWEAQELGLRHEEIDGGTPPKTRRPVADYVLEREDGDYWADWLQTRRYELSAFTTSEFVAWLDTKVAPYIEKVVPPPEVARIELEKQLERTVREDVIERILAAADVNGQVAAALAGIARPAPRTLIGLIRGWLGANQAKPWRGHVGEIAAALVARMR